MDKILVIILVQFLLKDVHCFVKSVAEVKWRGGCTVHANALNDCNWCRCNKQHQYACDARICSRVDKFGHFNDAIRELDIGMEGKGSWRSTPTSCEPGVQYRRDDLLCVCTDDGEWPNPVCRDTFRILHSVELTSHSEVKSQACSPKNLYVVGCKICYCPFEGKLDPKLCTKNECSKDDPLLNVKELNENNKDLQHQDLEIYAECDQNIDYKIGCKNCTCLKNNRLHCYNCTDERQDTKSVCSNRSPDEIFSRDCNLCYCNKNGFTYCTAKKCLSQQTDVIGQLTHENGVDTDQAFEKENCIPGHVYKVNCNTCFCILVDNKKVFGCTVKRCTESLAPTEIIHQECVKGTFYETNCLICQCDDVKGVKTQLCWVNPECSSDTERSLSLDNQHGYCEPRHVYNNDCNTCHCLADGKTLRCTSYKCAASSEDTNVDVIPVVRNGPPCPRGLIYKINCNYCFCLSNGNAICTRSDCDNRLQKI